MKNNLTRTAIIRDINTWTQAEKIDAFGQDAALTEFQDVMLRVKVANRLISYYAQGGILNDELKKNILFIMFGRHEVSMFWREKDKLKTGEL